ncbi:helix-turn-helix domain-containing protein [Quadrisphaera setariae]|uniref:Homeodomain-like domain-containing protein n=1 Tax=Quadrisphaera setariae TaxID=2593304 RepID=A0A5C8ZEA6_9ACTN|nr:helix-turn-helix domain-containing protein [Quadrisphaera setariae]TXR56385.1 hypothetical protein FMM08_09800 [Quadrisphaera setariae]
MDDDARDRRSGAGGRPYAAELRVRAAELRRDGVGSRQVAEQLGVSRATVCRWFREDGVLPLDLERHERAKVWAAEQAARRALDPARSYPGHRRHDPELREAAAEMRRQGLPRAEIARELGVGFSTVARWFREDEVSSGTDLRTTLQKRRDSYGRTVEERRAVEDREMTRWAAEVGDLSERDLRIIAAVLYWAEGSKSKPWRRSHRVIFVNSDPDMVRLFLRCLAVLGIERSRITCRLSIHESADVEAATHGWRRDVGDDLVFARPTLKRHNPVTVRLNTGEDYRGCLVITVAESASLYRRLAGTWNGVVASAEARFS